MLNRKDTSQTAKAEGNSKQLTLPPRLHITVQPRQVQTTFTHTTQITNTQHYTKKFTQCPRQVTFQSAKRFKFYASEKWSYTWQNRPKDESVTKSHAQNTRPKQNNSTKQNCFIKVSRKSPIISSLKTFKKDYTSLFLMYKTSNTIAERKSDIRM